MVWEIKWTENALKNMKQIDFPVQKKIVKFLKERIAKLENPRVFGKPLSYDKFGLWRYRIENFRIICRINDDALVVLVVQVGHRKEIYEKF